MVESLRLLAYALRSRFKSRARLEAENLVLRQQLNVLIRRVPKRVRLTNADRLRLVWLYWLFPSIVSAIRIIRPETLIRWHRRGFRAYWRWKSRPSAGRPRLDGEIRDLIRQMSMANPLWGAPRIHALLFEPPRTISTVFPLRSVIAVSIGSLPNNLQAHCIH